MKPANVKENQAAEARARRAARRAGYVARKTRWRRGSIDNYGGFAIINPENRGIVEGFRFELTAAEVIAWCEAA
jgi:hypothetical protein